MKITKQQLKQIIKEEIEDVLTNEVTEFDLEKGTRTERPPKEGENDPSRPKDLRSFVFQGDRSYAIMHSGDAQNTAGYRANIRLPSAKDWNKHMPGFKRLGGESGGAWQVETAFLPGDVFVKFPDGEERKYNSETGPEGERF